MSVDHDIPRFELRCFDDSVSLVFVDKVPEQNLFMLLGHALRQFVGMPMNSDTLDGMRSSIWCELSAMVARGDLVWNWMNKQWELEV